MTKITVQLGVSQNTDSHTFSLDELGTTQQEWDLLTEGEKNDMITKSVFDLPSQPFWMVDSFEEQ